MGSEDIEMTPRTAAADKQRKERREAQALREAKWKEDADEVEAERQRAIEAAIMEKWGESLRAAEKTGELLNCWKGLEEIEERVENDFLEMSYAYNECYCMDYIYTKHLHYRHLLDHYHIKQNLYSYQSFLVLHMILTQELQALMMQSHNYLKYLLSHQK